MNRRRNIGISLLAALMSGGVVYGLYQLQEVRLEQVERVAVVVPKQFVEAGKRLEQEDLTYRLLPREGLEEEMVLDTKLAVGLETVVPLGTNEPLLSWKLEKYRLLPTSEQLTFQIPREYIRSISNGIRAGDQVALYGSGEGESSTRLIDSFVTVASVKSSGNVEIDNVRDPNLLSLAEGDQARMYASRREANGMIDYINLNLTEDEWLQIDGYCKDGSRKLVIAFSPQSLNIVQQEVEKPT